MNAQPEAKKGTDAMKPNYDLLIMISGLFVFVFALAFRVQGIHRRLDRLERRAFSVVSRSPAQNLDQKSPKNDGKPA